MTAAELTELIRKTADVDDTVVLRDRDGVYSSAIVLVQETTPDGQSLLIIEPDLDQE